MFSFRQDLDQKRQEAIGKLCNYQIESLFLRFNTVFQSDYNSIELIKARTVTITCTKLNISGNIKITIATAVQGKLLEVAEELSKPSVTLKDLRYIFKYMLERDSFKPVFHETGTENVLKLSFEI